MIVNDDKLKKLINKATVYCNDCPIYEAGNWAICDKYRQKVDEDTYLKSCEKALLDWIQEFDVADALEMGAHIVNAKIIFPPQEIPEKPDYGVPCEQDGGADCDECKFIFDCPYR